MTYLDTPSEQKYKRNQNPGWDDHKIKQLRKLVLDGLSAGQIAHRLGFATRNAIIGKMHRLGIFTSNSNHGPRTAVVRAKPRHRTKGATVKPTNIHPQNVHKAYTHFTKKKRLRIALAETPSGTPTEPVIIKPSEYDQAIPQEQRLTILQLNGHTCRWPCGEPDQPEFFFCGGYTDHVYCQHHAMRAWR